MDNFITINNLHFSQGGKKIFDGIDLVIPKGKITAILGPSGTGKTTLLRLIGGQLRPHSGSIIVAQENVHQLSRKALFQLRKKMGMLFQSGALFTNLTVFENVAFPLREHTNLPPDVLRILVLIKLESVGLRGAAFLMPNELSGGMRRRVALARSIALDPELIMYDEPFSGLDPISLGVIMALIADINRSLGMTTVLVSHDLKEVKQIADYAYLLTDGKIVAGGKTAILFEDSTDPTVRQFIEGRPDGVIPFHYPADNYAESLLQ